MSGNVRRVAGVYPIATVRRGESGYSATMEWGSDGEGGRIVGRSRGVYMPDGSDAAGVVAAAWMARDAVARKLWDGSDREAARGETFGPDRFTDRDAYAVIVGEGRPGQYVVTFIPLHGADVIATELR